MNVAFFDLDGTLLEGDTDVLWGELLTRHGAFDPETTAAFQRDYSSGDLDADDFVARFLSPIETHGQAACLKWRAELMSTAVIPCLRAQTLERLEQHRSKGHELVMATATNEFLTRPIAEHLRIPHLLSSPAEVIDGAFTGRPDGAACFKDSKLRYATEWLLARGERWESVTAWAYSDSINDRPLLEAVHHPVVVDPDPLLGALATERGWEIVPG